MDRYILYVLNCRSQGLVPMDRQSWMQLGMPDTYRDASHISWLRSENPDELNRRANLFERIERK